MCNTLHTESKKVPLLQLDPKKHVANLMAAYLNRLVNTQCVSIDLSHGILALVDLQDISKHTMTVLGIK